MNNRTKIILGIAIAFIVTMASCSGCALITAGGYYLANKEKGEACKSTDRPASNSSKSQKPSNSKSSEPSAQELVEAIKPLEKVVTEFHIKLNEGDINAAYESLGSVFQERTDRESFIKVFSQVRDKFGKVEEISRDNIEVERKSIPLITVFYKVKYSNTTVNEKFIFGVFDTGIALYDFAIVPKEDS